MREIKPRAWHKDKKIMVEVSLINLDTEEIDYKGNLGEPVHWNHFVLMYPTGLKDKNGKEIYEGDIVRYRTTVSYDENEKKEVIKVVRYTGGGLFPVIFMEYEFHDFDDKPLTITEVEIIGNIYENSNLIKENKNVI